MSSTQGKSDSKYVNSIKRSLNAADSVDKCQVCSFNNDSGANFCEECGAALHQPSFCPNCGAIARSRADICELCGEWLLKGQCMFCYAPIDDGEKFCGMCGNPISGITCTRCGELSKFDFCSSCNIPLSHQAKAMVQAAAGDPTFLEFAALFEGLTDSGEVSASDGSNSIESVEKIAPDPSRAVVCASDDPCTLKVYRESLEKTKTVHSSKASASKPRNLLSSDQKERINKLNDEVFQEEERRRIEEERRRQEEERRRREEEERKRLEEERRRQEEERRREHELRLQQQLSDALNKFRGKTFSSNQEARRFFMSIIAGLPEEIAKKITTRGMGWRCNAYDCVHNSPSECADPSRGGVWLIR